MINDSPFALFDKFQGETELALECLRVHRSFRRLPLGKRKRRSHYRGDSLPLGSRSLQPDHLRKVKQIAKLFKATTIGFLGPKAVSLVLAQLIQQREHAFKETPFFVMSEVSNGLAATFDDPTFWESQADTTIFSRVRKTFAK